VGESAATVPALPFLLQLLPGFTWPAGIKHEHLVHVGCPSFFSRLSSTFCLYLTGSRMESSAKGGELLEEAAQDGGGVPIPGGVQDAFRCCTKGHGSEGKYWW